MFSSSPLTIALLLICALVPACRDDSAHSTRRVAVVQFENLSGDPKFDWVGTALAGMVTERFLGTENLYVDQRTDARAAASIRPSHLLHGYYDVRGGECFLNLSFEDAGLRKTIGSLKLKGTLPGDIVRLAGEVAAVIGAPPREFGSSDPSAIRSYGAAMASTDVETRTALLAESLEIDSRFSQAANLLASLYAGSGKPSEATSVLSRFLENASPDPVAAAQAKLTLALVDGTPETRAVALADYAALLPSDSVAAERAAQARLALREYAEAAEWYRKAVAAEPGRAELWNGAAYPMAYAGDLNGAVDALEHYRQAQPENPNTYDSLGEIHFRFGRLEEAEQYFLKTLETDPSFQNSSALVKAAVCRLYAGDRSGAGELFQEYASGRSDLGDQTIDYRKAQWNYWTGRPQQARDALAAITASKETAPVVKTLAHSQLAFWSLLSGDTATAKREVEAAALNLPTRVMDRTTFICQLLVRHAENTGAWEQLASAPAGSPDQAALQRDVMIYAHLLAGRFEEAIPVLEEAIATTPPFREDTWNILLAWASYETGDIERAASLAAPNPIIQPSAEDAFHSLLFPRILFLRGAIAAERGRTENAAKFLRAYLEYATGLPGAAGEVAKANEILSKLNS